MFGIGEVDGVFEWFNCGVECFSVDFLFIIVVGCVDFFGFINDFIMGVGWIFVVELKYWY